MGCFPYEKEQWTSHFLDIEIHHKNGSFDFL